MTKSIKRAGKAKPARAAAQSPVMQGGMPRALGVRILSLTRKKVIAEMRIKPMHANRYGNVNGGAMMAFGDVLGAAGAVANLPPGYRGGTIESKTNFLTAAWGPLLTGVSIPLHIGRTTSVWQTTIRDTNGRAVAVVTQTQIAIQAGPRAAPGARKKRGAEGK